MSTSVSEFDISLVRKLAKMDATDLFLELRSISDVQERRQTTQQVYDIKMRNYRSKKLYRGTMAHHLVDEVHPIFRTGFKKVLSACKGGEVNVKAFEQMNRSLHHHHEAEDQSWFPGLRREHPQICLELDVLEKDHASLVVMENEIKRGNYLSLVEFVDALNDHLNREELLLVPILLSN